MYNYIYALLKKILIYFKFKRDPTKDNLIQIKGQDLLIGKFTYGYESISILSWGENIDIRIGRFCSIGYGLKLFCGGNHNTKLITTYPFGKIFNSHFNHFDLTNKQFILTNGNIHIGNDVWIGRNVTIMSGITIGDGSVIAANSHVVNDVEPYTIYGGNPAFRIKHRFSEEIKEILLDIKWWNCDNELIYEFYNLLLREPNLNNINKIKNIIEQKKKLH